MLLVGGREPWGRVVGGWWVGDAPVSGVFGVAGAAVGAVEGFGGAEGVGGPYLVLHTVDDSEQFGVGLGADAAAGWLRV